MPLVATLRDVDQVRNAHRGLNDRCSTRHEGSLLMNATSISFGLLIVLFTILLLARMRRLKPQTVGFRSQRMCPSCGLITSRLNPRCLECGVASVPKR